MDGHIIFCGNTGAAGSFPEKIMDTVWDVLALQSLCICPGGTPRSQRNQHIRLSMELENES